jgi:hypothetical protein
METRHSNVSLSISRMGGVPALVIKGDTCIFVMGDAPLATSVSFTWIIGDAQWEHVSPFCHKSGYISDINLTEMRRKEDYLLFILHRTSSAPLSCEHVSFSILETIAFTRVSDLYL